MTEEIVLGDLVQGELIRYLPIETSPEGHKLQPMVIQLTPEMLRLKNIDLNDSGVDQFGSSKKGGIYYKALAFPDLITEPYYLGDSRIRISITGINLEETPLSNLFFHLKSQNMRLHGEVTSLKATIAWYSKEVTKLRTEVNALLQNSAEMRAIVIKDELDSDEEESTKGDKTD